MGSWADDPELVETFRAEVEERLGSLAAGLLQLEAHGAPKQLVAALFRDAHTVKGSARMLGLDGVLRVAHLMEDVLGAVRDARLAPRRDVVDVLLTACDGLSRALPGASNPVPADGLEAVLAALRAVLAGDEPVPLPVLDAVADEGDLEAAPDANEGARGVDSVRVAAGKVYDLLDVVGEAELEVRRVQQATSGLLADVTEQARWVRALRDALGAVPLPPEAEMALHRAATSAEGLRSAGRALRDRVEEGNGRMAQVRLGVMGLAMVPVGRVTAALPRLVRDVATATGKDVRLVVEGEDVALDKKVLDGVADALKHLVINAVDHGCEQADARRAAGKPAQATVTVSARPAGGTVVLEVRDDGAGIDEHALREAAVARGALPGGTTLSGPALLAVLFAPGFSTAQVVTELSGRGVGLDVVRSAVEDLGGAAEIRSEVGVGTTFALTLPVTLGVLRCLVARVGSERYAIPVTGVVESVSLRDAAVHRLAGAPVLVRHGATLPLVDLGAALEVAGERVPRAAVVSRHAATGEQLAWAVDRLEGELELVVKDLGPFLGRLPLVTGATIDGDGSVVFLVDLRELAVRVTGPGASSAVLAHAAAGDADAVRARSAGGAATAAGSPPGIESAPGVAAGGAAAAAAPGLSPATDVGSRPELPAQRCGERRPRVLLVEDSVGVRELERVILEGAGYDVTACVDGLDGASRLREEPADVVVSDVEMPGMDGFALTRQIRRTRGWEHVPVVIMTSRGDDADRRAGLEAGASAYLLKSGFDQAELVDTVRRLAGR